MERETISRLRVFVGALRAVAHELHGRLAVARTLVGANPAAQVQLKELEELLEDMGRMGQRACAFPVDLSSLVDRVVADVGARPKWRGVTIRGTGSGRETMCGDARLIERALRALVANAADACAAAGGGVVSVYVVAGGALDVVVNQTAPLPARDDLHRLLEPDFSSSKRTSAFGTGIPTACAIAAAHDGSLMADGASNAIVLRLPVSRGEVDDDREP